MGGTSQHVLEIADEPIDVSATRRLVDDVFVVVVAETAAQFFVVHLGLLLTGSPAARDLVWVA